MGTRRIVSTETKHLSEAATMVFTRACQRVYAQF